MYAEEESLPIGAGGAGPKRQPEIERAKEATAQPEAGTGKDLNMNFISLDLEMNKDANGRVDKIIQIGAVAFRLEPFEILETLSVIVNPEETLDPFIIKLTGITQEMVDAGVDLPTAYAKLCELKTTHQCGNYPVGWGSSDAQHLYQRVKTWLQQQRFIFSTHRHFDVKTLYQTYLIANGGKPQAGLRKACGRMGLRFEGPAHDALQDAINTARLFRRMCEVMKIPNTPV